MCVHRIALTVISFHASITERLSDNEDTDLPRDDRELWVDLVPDTWLCRNFVSTEDLGRGRSWNLGFVSASKLNVTRLLENEDLDLLELLEWRIEGVTYNLEDGDFTKVPCGAMFHLLILILSILSLNLLKSSLECFSLYWHATQLEWDVVLGLSFIVGALFFEVNVEAPGWNGNLSFGCE